MSEVDVAKAKAPEEEEAEAEADAHADIKNMLTSYNFIVFFIL